MTAAWSGEPEAWARLAGTDGVRATLGAGCYWGTEKFIARDFANAHPGWVRGTAVGFMGPADSPQNPTYKQVCAGDTGHVEVLDIKLAPEASYEELLRFFFRFHDPTTAARQGNDTGTQYASVIYTHSSEQASIAARVIAELQAHLDAGAAVPFETRKVTTQVLPATVFYPAHAEHQRYLEKNPGGYCNHRLRFSWESLPKL